MEPPIQRPTAPHLRADPQSSPASAAEVRPPAPALEQSRRAGYPPVWAQRLLLAIEVGICLWTGILVLVLPWTPLWTENPLLGTAPGLKLVLNLTFIRGMISGVGVVDLWMGVADALHYRDLR